MRKAIAIITAAIIVYALFWVSGQALGPYSTKEELIEQGVSEYRFIITTPEEYELIVKCVFAESANQSLEGQIAVAQVILNRYLDPRFKANNSFFNIICIPSQFTTYPALLNYKPNEQSYLAVDMALMGENLQIPTDVCFFAQGLNPGTEFYCRIGDHTFSK